MPPDLEKRSSDYVEEYQDSSSEESLMDLPPPGHNWVINGEPTNRSLVPVEAGTVPATEAESTLPHFSPIDDYDSDVNVDGIGLEDHFGLGPDDNSGRGCIFR